MSKKWKKDKQKDKPPKDKGKGTVTVASVAAKKCSHSAPKLLVLPAGKMKVFAGAIRAAEDFPKSMPRNVVLIDLTKSYKPRAEGIGISIPGLTDATVLKLDWPDMQVPKLDAEDWKSVADVLARMRRPFFVGCMAGHGRTGTGLSILLSLLNMVPKGKDPVEFVREIYCEEAVETDAQCEYVAKVTGREVKAKGTHKSYVSTGGSWTGYKGPASTLYEDDPGWYEGLGIGGSKGAAVTSAKSEYCEECKGLRFPEHFVATKHHKRVKVLGSSKPDRPYNHAEDCSCRQCVVGGSGTTKWLDSHCATCGGFRVGQHPTDPNAKHIEAKDYWEMKRAIDAGKVTDPLPMPVSTAQTPVKYGVVMRWCEQCLCLKAGTHPEHDGDSPKLQAVNGKVDPKEGGWCAQCNGIRTHAHFRSLFDGVRHGFGAPLEEGEELPLGISSWGGKEPPATPPVEPGSMTDA